MASAQPLVTPEVATTKRDLRSWWKNFTNRERKEEEKAGASTSSAATQAPAAHPGIFGCPLHQSIKYANVAISLLDAQGKSFTYGYVPIVVAKCGVFLKEKATEVEGIFRLAGAERRVKELQAIFNSPDKFGKGLDWTGYTVHDAANVLRRYFNQLPEPVIPLNYYERFRDPIRGHQAQAVGDMGDQQHPSSGEFESSAAIKTYQRLITEIPSLNRQLLLYILDLLAVFASKSDINHMNAPNLSIIFQPGTLSHPDHFMSPADYRLSQDVLIFLIDNQDHFLVGMQGTAADEKTIQEVQGGSAVPPPPPPPLSSTGSGSKELFPSQGRIPARSSSGASAGAESVRRFGGVRRNVSTNSRRSHTSNNTPSPVTPPPESPYSPARSGGVYRSNTVPSRKSQSPSVGTARFEREKSVRQASLGMTGGSASGTQQQSSGSTQTPSSSMTAELQAQSSAQAKTEGSRHRSTQARERDPERLSPHLRPIKDKRAPSTDRQLRMDLPSSLLGTNSQSPSHGRKPNKLQKRRPDGTPALGTKTSNHSLSGASHPPSPAQAAYGFSSPRQAHSDSRHPEPPTESIDQMTEMIGQHYEPVQTDYNDKYENQRSMVAPGEDNASTETSGPMPQRSETIRHAPIPQGSPRPTHALKDAQNRDSSATIKPDKSPAGSLHSYSMTGDELSSQENTDAEHHDRVPKKAKRHSRWRLSTSARKEQKESKNGASIGDAADAERSTSSVGSYSRPRKSFTDDSKESTGYLTASSEHEGNTPEKKGPIGWFKGKLQERKERAKSPPPGTHRSENGSGTNSLNAAVSGESGAHGRGKSMEALVEDNQEGA